jgi:iron complex transport system substrate-binding protein
VIPFLFAAMVLIFFGMLGVFAASAYPVSYSSCGVDRTVSQSPQRIVTLNQGATELMFALGLATKMVGTAYLDDYIWPKYASEYAKIPVLAKSYPNESTIMSVKPDFIAASYNSAFRQTYEDKGKTKGIFSNATVGPCVGTGSVWGADIKPTCRPQLHAAGISTYLFQDHCEDKSLRPRTVTEQTVYEEVRTLGRIFNLNVDSMINDMKNDFDAAGAMLSSDSQIGKAGLKAVWLDCISGCCEKGQVFVGAGAGPPNMLMSESGLTNAFKSIDASWKCVSVSDIKAANPDIFVIVDADWDTASSKLTWLYNNSDFCSMDALEGARLVQIPFSATTLSPRNAPAALDLAIATLHVRTGKITAERESGVSSFSAASFKKSTDGLVCTLIKSKVKYDITTDASTTASTTASTMASSQSSNEANSAFTQKERMLWPFVLACFVACF